MNVIFTCGGTAGHVNPALALAGFLRERDPKTRILFVGAERGLERDLIAHTPYPFRTVNISSFHRSLRPKELRHNLVSVRNLMHAKREADAILDEFQPDLIVGTGGYASYPVVRYGHARGIPTAVHESNAVPGLTTRLLENHCDRILVGFEDCRRYYKHKDRVVVTGTPVRGDFFTQTKAQAKEKLSVNDGRPLVVSFWGSLGAGNMNRVTAELLYLEAAKEPFYHIPSVGSLGWQKMHEWVSGYGVDLRDHPSLDVREYIYDMADVMRAADLVICRAGASTLSELTALGVPAILVPSPSRVSSCKSFLVFSGEVLYNRCVIIQERKRRMTDAIVQWLLSAGEGKFLATVIFHLKVNPRPSSLTSFVTPGHAVDSSAIIIAPSFLPRMREFRCLKNQMASRFSLPPYLFGTH